MTTAGEPRLARILLATDLSPLSATARAFALLLARAHGAHVELLHAIEPLTANPDDVSFDGLYAELLERARVALTEEATMIHSAGVSCSTVLLVAPRARAVVDRARSTGVDLVVMGTRRPRDEGPRGLVTTSAEVFETSPVPLLLVPVDAHAARPSTAA